MRADLPGYWAHLLVAAHQGPENSDIDPDEGGDPADKGLTYYRDVPLVGVFSHSAVYLETIRDTYKGSLAHWARRPEEPENLELIQNDVKLDVLGTVAHEIGHGPRPLTDELLLRHGVNLEEVPREGPDRYDEHAFEEGLMQAGAERINLQTFSPRTLLRFRLAGSWCTRNDE